MGDEKLDYDEWRHEVGVEDTEENRGWYECQSEEECVEYIHDHPDWWENF